MSTKTLARRNETFPSIIEEFFRPWNSFFGGDRNWDRAMTVPAMNVSENQDSYKVTLAAPGLNKSDFKINVEGDALTISSETEERKEEKDEKYSKEEYNYSSFTRSFTLPEDVNREKIEAMYEDGVLKLTLPKKDEARKPVVSKQISVK